MWTSPLSFTENIPLASHPLSCLPPPPSDFFMLHFRSCDSLTYEYIRNSFITWVKPRGAASAISMQMNCCLLCFVRQYMFIYSAQMSPGQPQPNINYSQRLRMIAQAGGDGWCVCEVDDGWKDTTFFMITCKIWARQRDCEGDRWHNNILSLGVGPG